MVQLRWILEAEPALADGRPHMAVRQFGLSLSEQSHLRPFLEAWRGQKFTDEQLEGFDLEVLIGKPCQLQIIHTKKEGVTYGNVQGAFPLGKGMLRLEVPKDYVRAQDRPDYRPPIVNESRNIPASTLDDSFDVEDNDAPF
jgi:hypothetical protein